MLFYPSPPHFSSAIPSIPPPPRPIEPLHVPYLILILILINLHYFRISRNFSKFVIINPEYQNDI